MKKTKVCLALFTTISLLLTACDNMGMTMEMEGAGQSKEPIKLSQITVDVSNTVTGNGNVLLIGGVQVFLERVPEEETNQDCVHEDVQEVAVPEVSREEAVVAYAGVPFIKRVFAVGGDRIYMAGRAMDGKDFFGSMKAEENTFTHFAVEMPENMQVLNMTVDAQGSCHMLWVSAQRQVLDGVEHNIMDFEQCSITKVNADGELEAVMDVSAIFAETQNRPYCFITDADGCYYLDSGNEILKLYPDGSIAAHIVCDGRMEAIGCAKDGSIYCIYMTEDGEEILGCVEADRVTDCGVSMPEVHASYSSMVAGTDTELLLFNKEGGVFTYSANTNTLESRVISADLPVAGQEISGCGFLGDGRLCLMSQEEEAATFYYISAGE